MATEAELLRRIQNLEGANQALAAKVDAQAVTLTQLRATLNSLVTTVNGMNKP